MSKKTSAQSEQSFFNQASQAIVSLVHINVGGTVFTTSRITLLKYDSIFKEILSKNLENSLEIAPNTLFFDRDPQYFHLILNYFRTGVMNYPQNQQEKKMVLIEIHFYQVKNLIEKKTFKFENLQDNGGVFYYLGLRSRYSFENPVDAKEIELYMGEQYICYLGSKQVEMPLKHLVDFYDKINEEKPIFSTKNAKEPFLIIRFRSARVKPDFIRLENLREGHVDYNPKDLLFSGALTENLEEAVKDKGVWSVLESKYKEKQQKWRLFELLSYEFVNTIKIENVLLENTRVVVSGIEIYGSLTEKG